MQPSALLLAACLGTAVAASPAFDNMNGAYTLSDTPNQPKGKAFPTKFADFPGGVEYFEVRCIAATSLCLLTDCGRAK
jgi:hypothetical protein